MELSHAGEKRALSKLTPYPRNARTHSDAQIAKIAASITGQEATLDGRNFAAVELERAG